MKRSTVCVLAAMVVLLGLFAPSASAAPSTSEKQKFKAALTKEMRDDSGGTGVSGFRANDGDVKLGVFACRWAPDEAFDFGFSGSRRIALAAASHDLDFQASDMGAIHYASAVLTLANRYLC
jgi:hypothetical protein